MEYGSVTFPDDENDTSTENEVSESAETKANLENNPKLHLGSLEEMIQIKTGDFKGGENVSHAVQADLDASAEVNMEASITSDDIMRAGGFGARDDISSILPVASDSTDFEASLRDARDYDDPQEEICRPGLGWTEATNDNVQLIHIIYLGTMPERLSADSSIR